VLAVLAVIAAIGAGAAAGQRLPHGPPTPLKPIVQDNAMFLCYSKFQVIPGVWDVMQAPALIALGYWPAYALPGNVPDGTNVDGYHLVCNPDATNKSTGDFRDHNGMDWTPDFSWLIGIYPGETTG
jgi:hypothetical protein